jgi:hypothetical protein
LLIGNLVIGFQRLRRGKNYFQRRRNFFFCLTNISALIFYSDHVYVEGTLRYNDYLDKDGNPRTKAEINQSKGK